MTFLVTVKTVLVSRLNMGVWLSKIRKGEYLTYSNLVKNVIKKFTFHGRIKKRKGLPTAYKKKS